MLPNETLRHIGTYLQSEDILNLMLVNKTLYKIFLGEYFLKTDQKFLYHIRCYNAMAKRQETEKKSIDRQIIQRNQFRFQSFEQKIRNGLKALPNDGGNSSIYNDCFKLANEILNEHKSPELYYESNSSSCEKFIFIILFSLSVIFSVYGISQQIHCYNATREAENFWSLKAKAHDCCLRKDLKNMSEACQEIYMGYHNPNITGRGSTAMESLYVVLHALNLFVMTLMLSTLMMACSGANLEERVFIFASIKKLKWKHNRSLQKIARTFPDLLETSSIRVLVDKLMEIYEKQPSFSKNSSLCLEGHKLLKGLNEMKENNRRTFNYSDNQQITLFGKKCDQFEAECKLTPIDCLYLKVST